MAIIGVTAYVLVAVRIPITPIILGMVLGPTLENEFRTAMMLSEGKMDIFYTSPTVIVFFSLAALLIVFQSLSELKMKRKEKQKEDLSDA
jgi:putative tricarboxylic transport membrane protein